MSSVRRHAFVLHEEGNVEWSWRCVRCKWHLRTCTPGEPEPGAYRQFSQMWSPDGRVWGRWAPKGCESR